VSDKTIGLLAALPIVGLMWVFTLYAAIHDGWIAILPGIFAWGTTMMVVMMIRD
jgi:hypothetical protein